MSKVFVGVHGGAFGNLLWASSANNVVELLPNNNVYKAAMHWHMAHFAGATYRYDCECQAYGSGNEFDERYNACSTQSPA